MREREGEKKHYLGLEKICKLAGREEKDGRGELSILKDMVVTAASNRRERKKPFFVWC